MSARMLGQTIELAFEEADDMLLPLRRMRHVRLHVIAPLDAPELGPRIRARGLQIVAVVRRDRVVAGALDDEERALRVRGDDLGRLDLAAVESEEHAGGEDDPWRDPRGLVRVSRRRLSDVP